MTSNVFTDPREELMLDICPFFATQEPLQAVFNFAVCGLGRLSHIPESPQLVQSDETSVRTGGFLPRISLGRNEYRPH